MSIGVINDPLKLESIFKIDGVATDLTGEEAFFDYYIPGNATSTPDGTWSAVVETGITGAFYYDIPQDTLNSVGVWKFQPSGTNGGNTYHEQNTTCHTVVNKGGSCS